MTDFMNTRATLDTRPGAVGDTNELAATPNGNDFDAQLAAGEGQKKGRLPLRIMAGNITSGNDQSYDPGHGQRIFQAFSPDVALVQEFNYGNNSKGDIEQFVRDTFGEDYHYFREANAQIPNGVVSRFPIIDSGTWKDSHVGNRSHAWAKIDLPDTDKDLVAVSVHLLTRNPGVRDAEAREIVDYIRNNVDEDDMVVLGGDFNTARANEPAIRTFEQLFSTEHQPADADGRIGTNAKRTKPYDWVLPDKELNNFHIPVQVGEQNFPHGLVFDSRVFDNLEDVAPVQKGDSGAPAMQHMAVIKDFLVPTEAMDANYTAPWMHANDAGPEQWDNAADNATETLFGDDDLGAADLPASGQGLKIVSALPNPAGGDEGNEQVTLRNDTDAPIDLAGFEIRDRSGSRHTLEGEVAPGETLTITLPEDSVALGNSGDEIRLFTADGEVADEVAYSKSQVNSGEPIDFSDR